jgi:hypothetical protein
MNIEIIEIINVFFIISFLKAFWWGNAMLQINERMLIEN